MDHDCSLKVVGDEKGGFLEFLRRLQYLKFRDLILRPMLLFIREGLPVEVGGS